MNNNDSLPLISLLPNFITLIGLILGLTSIKYSINALWQPAVALIVISAFIDGLDGRIARALNATSELGASLDSLVDFINFGVAPAILIYLWSLNNINFKGVGWAITIFYVICIAFRLARFNSSDKNDNYFYGISAPCAGGILILPVILTFHFNILYFQNTPYLLGIFTIILSLLTASKIPTISIKNVTIKRNYIVPFLIITAIFFILLFIFPWFILPIIGLLYIATIPITIYKFYTNEK